MCEYPSSPKSSKRPGGGCAYMHGLKLEEPQRLFSAPWPDVGTKAKQLIYLPLRKTNGILGKGKAWMPHIQSKSLAVANLVAIVSI